MAAVAAHRDKMKSDRGIRRLRNSEFGALSAVRETGDP